VYKGVSTSERGVVVSIWAGFEWEDKVREVQECGLGCKLQPVEGAMLQACEAAVVL
jgi:hypothetical protein